MSKREYTVVMMNMILKGEMEPLMNASENPDRAAIDSAVKPYGAPGEKILLRAKTGRVLQQTGLEKLCSGCYCLPGEVWCECTGERKENVSGSH